MPVAVVVMGTQPARDGTTIDVIGEHVNNRAKKYRARTGRIRKRMLGPIGLYTV